jgi:hypothetical protein
MLSKYITNITAKTTRAKWEAISKKKLKKLSVSSAHVNGKYHPLLQDIAVLMAIIKVL